MQIHAMPLPNVSQTAAAAMTPQTRLARDFEAMLLAPMVEAMLPDVGAVFGEGPGAGVWRSQLAAAIADTMGERGVLGLGAILLSNLGEQHSEQRP